VAFCLAFLLVGGILCVVGATLLMWIVSVLHGWWAIIPVMPFWTALITVVLLAALVNAMTLLNLARN
jgi:hypothetical protein